MGEIIQTEEYLPAADIDLIHKRADIDSIHNRKKRSMTSSRSLSSNRAGEAAGDPTFGNLFNLFRPAIRIPSQIMTRIPRFRFKDRPKPNPIRIQNVFVDPPIVPINVAQPGEPGGGGTPASNPAIADNLVPRGLRPVAVFPPYLFPRTVPAQCLIFLEPDPPKKRPVYGSDQYRPPRPQNPRPQKRLAFPILRNVNNYFKSLSRTFKRKLRRQRRIRKRVRRDYQKAYRTHLVEVPSFERRYGFRCKITLVDKQQCQLGVSCDSEGNRLSERIIKRQAGEEFLATGPPECRTELSPLGCTPAVQN